MPTWKSYRIPVSLLGDPRSNIYMQLFPTILEDPLWVKAYVAPRAFCLFLLHPFAQWKRHDSDNVKQIRSQQAQDANKPNKHKLMFNLNRCNLSLLKCNRFAFRKQNSIQIIFPFMKSIYIIQKQVKTYAFQMIEVLKEEWSIYGLWICRLSVQENECNRQRTASL